MRAAERWIGAGLLLLVAGCAREPAAPALEEFASARDLLWRTPSGWIREVGELRPTADEQWGDFGLGGWLPTSSVRADGLLYMESRQREASLWLPTVERRDRTLELELWATYPRNAPTRPLVVTLSLEGHELGRVELDVRPGVHRFECAAEHWTESGGTLTFSVEDDGRPRRRPRPALAVARVDYGRRSFPTHSEVKRELLLPGGSAALYDLETFGPTAIRLNAAGVGEGRLVIRSYAVDPHSGASRPVGRPVTLRPEAGELDAVARVEHAEGAVARLELLWDAPADSVLSIDRLQVLEEEARTLPPIVFVSLDTLTARHTSLHGYERPTTPSLEAFAAEAVVFEDARTNAPFTVQSYMSQFTGLFPPAHRLGDPVEDDGAPFLWRDHLADERWTLAEMLLGLGYRTAAWVDNPWLARDLGWEQGFELYDTSAAEPPNEIQNPTGGIHHVAPLAEEWITSRREGVPFFAFVQVLDPHGPYLPSGAFEGRFRADEHYERSMLPTGEGQLHVWGVVPEYVARGLHPSGTLPAEVDGGLLVADYDAKIAQTDARLGRFFDVLRESDLWDRALVVVTADHGESMTEHGYYFDHGTLYDEVLHVPLLVRLPGGEGAGTRRTEPVQLVDLFPTIAQAVGLPVRDYLHGRPLFDPEGYRPEPVLSECGIQTQASIVHEGWKLIRSEPLVSALQTRVSHPLVDREWLSETIPWMTAALRSKEEMLTYLDGKPKLRSAFRSGIQEQLRGPVEELFDLSEDPGELRDLADERPDVRARLGALLDEALERGRASRAAIVEREVDQEFTDEELESLGDLGYLDPDEHRGD